MAHHQPQNITQTQISLMHSNPQQLPNFNTLPGVPNYQSNQYHDPNSSFYPPISSAEFHAAIDRANFFSCENANLRGELKLVRQELQKCYVFVAKQNQQIKAQENRCAEHEKRCVETFKTQLTEKDQLIETMKKQIQEQSNDLKLKFTLIYHQHKDLERVDAKRDKAEKKIKSLEDRVKELETIMHEQQQALEAMELQKMLLEGKLEGIRNFAMGINRDFDAGVKALRKDFGGEIKVSPPTIEEPADKDEIELTKLRKSLTDLSGLVRDALEQCFQPKQNEDTGNKMRIRLRRQSSGGSDEGNISNSSNNDWSIVRPSCSLKRIGGNHQVIKKLPCTLCKKRFIGMPYLRKHYELQHHIPFKRLNNYVQAPGKTSEDNVTDESEVVQDTSELILANFVHFMNPVVEPFESTPMDTTSVPGNNPQNLSTKEESSAHQLNNGLSLD